MGVLLLAVELGTCSGVGPGGPVVLPLGPEVIIDAVGVLSLAVELGTCSEVEPGVGKSTWVGYSETQENGYVRIFCRI